jgi:hypothetical protein
MSSRLVPKRDGCGLRGTGPGVMTAITGYPGHGFRLHMREPSGLRRGGAGKAATIAFMMATGAIKSGTTAASITAMATWVSDLPGASGAVEDSPITPQLCV